MFLKWWLYGMVLAFGVMLFGAMYMSLQNSGSYQWVPEPTMDDRRFCAPAGSMFDCFRTLGYKWERVK